ncbi:DNA mismatch repair protein [Desulfonema limicola]|uniref:DNA mismatch repair protein MutS n=1 Tax=Desulfonema limicola TaxID=45656 RepID=A0A975BAX8_9BACT|nr:DNA mismatch repair protein MutS [Desulfonema limicola]QTA81947.1 DNA mismatch repair protein [Desulfonema limicola]
MQPNTTPMMKQYLSIKEQYPDAILFYRMGDFYEMFFKDAETASRLLEITLTSRNKNHSAPIPMCGIPYRAVQSYIAKLIEMGRKVAICDQVEDPALAKGLVKREVVRVITPGMIIENEFLDAKSNNYVLALYKQGKQFGLSFLDISTGTFRVAESDKIEKIISETLRAAPSEILLPESFKKDSFFELIINSVREKAITFLKDKYFDYNQARASLMEILKTLSLEGFGCEHLKSGIGAAGAVLHYVGETQKQKIEHITSLETYTFNDFMAVDESSCKNLELMENLRTGTRTGTLLEVLDLTVTSMGGRLLREWLRYPLMKIEDINRRLEAVDEARVNTMKTAELRESLKSVYDLERLGSRIVMGHASARDMTALKKSLNMLPGIISLVSGFKSPLFVWEYESDLLHELAILIEKSIREDAPVTINEGKIIKTGYNKELDELIKISRDGKGWLAKLEVQERKSTGINSVKVRFNKVFGYYLEVPKNHSQKVPSHYIRKQTLVNAERYITDELKDFESKVLNAEDRRAALEYEIFNQVRAEVCKYSTQIKNAARYIAHLDCLLNLGCIAVQNDYTRPEINTKGNLIIEDGRHPVIEKMITGERFVPNTISMDDIENQIMIITGPNMAGKSTVLRQAALMAVMAQMGSFVPASYASICLTDKIFTRVGALDNLSQGQSTFMVEMQETANILNNATSKSLVILDEIGRGTSTYDGLSIAWAVAEYLHDLREKGVKTLFATHYHELTELEQHKPRVKNYNIAVKEINDEIIFLRKLVKGGTNRSYGIQVARLAGIPEKVIERSKTILAEIETNAAQSKNLNNVSEQSSYYEKKPVQLDLFAHEAFLTQEIKSLEIAKMAPLEALNFLNKLQEKIKIC